MTSNGGEQPVARRSAALIGMLIARSVGVTAGVALALLLVAAMLAVR